MFENLKIGEIARTVVRQVLEAGISDTELNISETQTTVSSIWD